MNSMHFLVELWMKVYVLDVIMFCLLTSTEKTKLYSPLLLNYNLNKICISVRKNSFYVGSTIYARCEVVAMEWLVQEVLNFKCFLPTVYNFLWYILALLFSGT